MDERRTTALLAIDQPPSLEDVTPAPAKFECIGNKFPLLLSDTVDTQNMTGKLPKGIDVCPDDKQCWGDVLTRKQLKPLTTSSEWVTGDTWEFTVFATSTDTKSQPFGFS